MVQMLNGGPIRTSHDLAAAEDRWGCQIPASYRTFLLTQNGGEPKPYLYRMHCPVGDTIGAISKFFGVDTGQSETDLNHYVRFVRNHLPSGFFPIGIDPADNVLCIKMASPNLGAVYLWAVHPEKVDESLLDDTNPCYICETFEAFLRELDDLDELRKQL